MKPFWKPYAHHYHSDRYFQKCRKWVVACGGGHYYNPRQGFRNFSPWKRCYAAMLLWWLVVAGLVSAAIFTSQRHWAVADNTLPKGYLCHGEAGGRDPPPQSTSVQTGGTSLQNIFECRQIFKYLWQTVTIPNGLEGPRTSLESLSVLTLWHLTALREMLILLFYVLLYSIDFSILLSLKSRHIQSLWVYDWLHNTSFIIPHRQVLITIVSLKYLNPCYYWFTGGVNRLRLMMMGTRDRETGCLYNLY